MVESNITLRFDTMACSKKPKAALISVLRFFTGKSDSAACCNEFNAAALSEDDDARRALSKSSPVED